LPASPSIDSLTIQVYIQGVHIFKTIVGLNVLTRIKEVTALEVLDSRGNPTLSVEVGLENGARGMSMVPSGASTGKHEALELRDNDSARYLGKGVLAAVDNVNKIIAPEIIGSDALNQKSVDRKMIELDGTENKSKLGSNSILGVSMAVCKAAAASENLPLYRYIGEDGEFVLPVPMMNILNGGQHADNNIDIQEFMIFPAGAGSFSEALRMGVETFHLLKKELSSKGLATSVGDEGGFAPNLKSNEEAIEIILEAAEKTGHGVGKNLFLAIDSAATSFYDESKESYTLESEDRNLGRDELIDYYVNLVEKYPIISLEDGLHENDWSGWAALNEKIGDKIQIVGDDILATNKRKLSRAIEENSCNSILIKLNQVGTLTETLETIEMAKKNGFTYVISHRSGETEDTMIADLAVATGSGQIKAGSASRSDRIAKYNRLLRIESELGGNAKFKGLAGIKN